MTIWFDCIWRAENKAHPNSNADAHLSSCKEFPISICVFQWKDIRSKHTKMSEFTDFPTFLNLIHSDVVA